MKRWLILIALLMSSVAWAGSTTVVVGQGAGYEIEDDFGSDTSANYTKIKDVAGSCSLVISGGVCRQSPGTVGMWFHTTALSSVNHYVQASVLVGVTGDPAYGDYTALIVRSDGSSGATSDCYYIDRHDTTFDLYRMVNDSATYLTSSSSGQATGTHTMRVEVSGTDPVNITVYYNGSEIINYNDDSAARLQTGSYIGMRIKYANNGTNLDDLIGDNL